MNKNLLFKVMTLIMLSLWVSGANAQERIVRVLAIGNSFSQDAVEQNLHELCVAADRSIIIGNMYIPGCSIERHISCLRGDKHDYAYRKIELNGDKKETKNFALRDALKDEPWDYITVQQASHDSGKYETYDLLQELLDSIRLFNPNAKILFHQTWAYAPNSTHSGFKYYGRSQNIMYNNIVEVSKKVMNDYKIDDIIPSGTAIQNARSTYLGNNLTRDGYHLDLIIGRYIVACTWFECLIHKKVVGNRYYPKGLSLWDLKTVQTAAHRAVKNPYAVSMKKKYMVDKDDE